MRWITTMRYWIASRFLSSKLFRELAELVVWNATYDSMKATFSGQIESSSKVIDRLSKRPNLSHVQEILLAEARVRSSFAHSACNSAIIERISKRIVAEIVETTTARVLRPVYPNILRRP